MVNLDFIIKSNEDAYKYDRDCEHYDNLTIDINKNNYDYVFKNKIYVKRLSLSIYRSEGHIDLTNIEAEKIKMFYCCSEVIVPSMMTLKKVIIRNSSHNVFNFNDGENNNIRFPSLKMIECINSKVLVYYNEERVSYCNW